jgi:Fe(II)/alpha-ketoglutarate-dependent arginine beta-hydroxylase
MIVYELADDETAALLRSAREIGIAELSASHPRLLEVIAFASSELPRSLRRTLGSFRLNEQDGVALVRGCPIESDLRATPAHWSETPEAAPATVHEIVALLIASLLGDPFGRVAQQAGRVIQDVVPAKTFRPERRDSSFSAGLDWHSEDAFHECRPDYLALFCLRNPDSVATTYAEMSELELTAADRSLLFDAEFIIRPDDAAVVTARPHTARSYALTDAPPKVATLFGDPGRPYIRLDPSYTDVPDSAAHHEAYRRLCAAADQATRSVHLRPGDCLLVDNLRVVHGRAAFHPRFDGADRWLKRVGITRNLRQYGHLRAGLTRAVV